MIVYRIEDINGRGIYQYHNQAEKACRAYIERNFDAIDILHPPPKNDTLLKHRWENDLIKSRYKFYRFGFLNKEQLLDWFPKKGLLILNQVFNVNLFHDQYAKTVSINEYNVPKCHVLIGDKQIAFLTHFAKKVNSTSLEKFCEGC